VCLGEGGGGGYPWGIAFMRSAAHASAAGSCVEQPAPRHKGTPMSQHLCRFCSCCIGIAGCDEAHGQGYDGLPLHVCAGGYIVWTPAASQPCFVVRHRCQHDTALSAISASVLLCGKEGSLVWVGQDSPHIYVCLCEVPSYIKSDDGNHIGARKVGKLLKSRYQIFLHHVLSWNWLFI